MPVADADIFCTISVFWRQLFFKFPISSTTFFGYGDLNILVISKEQLLKIRAFSCIKNVSLLKKVVSKNGILIFHWYFSYEKSGITKWNLGFLLSISHMKKMVSKYGILIFHQYFSYEKSGIKRSNLGFLLSISHIKKVVSKDGILIFHQYFSYEKSGIKIWNLDFPLVFLM